ncbi:MAG: cytochrome d ubiquinol oxidase subunit II [Candidatus Sericytochromatia bacterium]|nr:cytochrome d ubiquinol oxidase subunit II [Candidatus Sericytochromatia bacterium]
MSFDLNIIWFLILGLVLSGYAILDGFDLGVGALHLFTKTDDERRIMLNSIGPVWDGNEVWLVVSGGVMFAAFPDVYATVFSGFYPIIMLILVSLIFRAVAIEFRSKHPSTTWRKMWDIAFSLSSIFIAFLFGMSLANVIIGVPINVEKEYIGGIINLLNPYSILLGITTVALFMMHGSIYVVMKTENEMHKKIRGWVNNSIIFFVICYITTTMATLIYYPHLALPFKNHPILFFIAILNMLAIANIPRQISKGEDFYAFLSSSISIAALMGIVGIGVFPNLVLSSVNSLYNLNIYNSASSHKTLSIILIVACIGLPSVLSYTGAVYWIFRGKVKIDSRSY